MTLVTPSGYRKFDWSPKADGLTKTASTGEQEKSDKDLLFEAAAKFVKAQAEEKKEDKPKESAIEKKSDDDKEDKGEDKGNDKPCDTPPCDKKDDKKDDKPAEGEVAPDVQKAVGELVEKAKKADEVAAKVQDAVAKVEQAVQEVKEVAGVTDADLPAGDAEVDIPGVVGDAAPVDEVEIELDVPAGDVDEVGDIGGIGGDMGGDMGGGMAPMGDELVNDLGVEKEGMATCASNASYVKLSSVSKETAKKVTTFWKDYLGYPEDYVKLMVKNYEK